MFRDWTISIMIKLLWVNWFPISVYYLACPVRSSKLNNRRQILTTGGSALINHLVNSVIFCLLGSLGTWVIDSSHKTPMTPWQLRLAPQNHTASFPVMAVANAEPRRSPFSPALSLIMMKCWNIISSFIFSSQGVMLLQLIACVPNVSLHIILFYLLIACA